MTERALQDAIVQTAKLFGYLCYHTFLSVRSAPGFPDLVLARSGRLIMVECKGERGKLTPAQEHWLGVLGGVPGVEVFVFRPADWRDGRVEAALR